ncbi:MAG: formylmethanofuran dehydrogenase subunit B, partial [Methanocalculaceae archaeon]|nr:formylmethanofuran dehydrogenase subunit B [Methanocalculaceae archaeon]
MKLLMSSGRTSEQGAKLYYKDTKDYSREISYCFLNPMDMMEIGVEEGEHVLIESSAGKIVFNVRESADTPEGVAFVPCGPHANFILHEFTHSTGAPDFKGIPVVASATNLPLQSAWDLMEELGGLRYEIPAGTTLPNIELGEKIIKNHA